MHAKEMFPEIIFWGNNQDVELDIRHMNQGCMPWNLMNESRLRAK